MSIWLKKRLAIWLGVSLCGALCGALWWNVGASRAQNSDSKRHILGLTTPRVPLTRDEATRNFVKLLELIQQHPYGFMGEPEAVVMSSFSLKSERELNEGVNVLIRKMAEQWKRPQQAVRVQRETETTATVTIDEAATPVTRSFILVREGESWGVDVLETYAHWNGLEGEAKTAAFARLSIDFKRARDNARRASCQSNLKQIAFGMIMYSQDYDEKLPSAKPWIDVLKPYVGKEQIFTCPAVTDSKGYGYAYNSKLSGKLASQVSNRAQTASFYETSILKRNAFGMGENRAFRHQNGANYAFADGHVKWFPKSATPSFKLKP
ncbi:MAG TPA: DUF1559 domain-containing protein [Abditibacterium sp.]|jgi:prepilin-type processing-associated H-X9-DG protein